LSKSLSGKVILTTGLHCNNTMTQAGKRERMITNGPDVMLGLPKTPTLNARTGVKRIDDTPPENVIRDRWRINEQASRRRGRPGLIRSHLAKDKPQSRAVGTKPGRRCHRKVQLERARQQKYAVNTQTTLKISESYRAEFVGQLGRPIIENLDNRDMIGNAERQVQVREAIAATVQGEGTDDGPGDNAVILLRQP
jgi:hypothetical protein